MQKTVATMTLALGLALASAGPASAGRTLDAVKARGVVNCGVSQGNPGFSAPDSGGVWRGFDVDMCRAVSTAVFGVPDKVAYIPLVFASLFTALQTGEVDIVTRTVTWTMGRDMGLGVDFPMVTFYSGQTFMVPKKLGVTSAKQLDGASICVTAGTTTEANLNDYFKVNNMKFNQVLFEDQNVQYTAYEAGRCDAVSTEPTILASRRSIFKNPDDHIIFKDYISKEPTGPAVRHGDDEWRDIVKASLFALVAAEEYGITSKNVKDQLAGAKVPEVRRFLGLEGDIGQRMGLKPDWAAAIIAQVGNYEEIFERNLGPNTPLKLERGYNRLYTQGGLMIAPPFR